ncbi:MAG: tetratricopeptide repeat protein [Tannerella sp.]|nr:tetratricopeptide repeat protein [Tannerella sp.]
MKKRLYFVFLIVGLVIFACSTQKNTSANRRFHAFTARYNTYFNGKTAFDEQFAAQNNGYIENYTEQILMFPVSAQPKDKQTTGGTFDRAIEKGNKAIKQHSIQKKPARKAGWQNNPKLVAMQEKNEYNPFLKNCWMLVAQGQFYNADFLQASATFSYITRHYADDPEMVAEARIWQARCYAEMNWLHEAGTIYDNLKQNGMPDKNMEQYDRFYADYLIKNGELEKSVPYLQTAIKSENNKRQRTRMRYLLGQIYSELGQNENAYQIFRKVAGSSPPYELEFAARIRQTEVMPGSSYQEVLKMLNRMAKNPKNKDFLDQVYYAVGNVYMNRQDTVKAIENYALGIEKSTKNGLDKAICQIRLGDIYFTQKDYVKAQPCFSGAMAGIQKEYKDYERIARLSEVLDELVVHVEAVHLQDSLQVLAKMPEKELYALIDSMIEDVKKKEEEAKKAAEMERYLAEQASYGTGLSSRTSTTTPMMLPTVAGESSFYFYNPMTVASGKTQFQNLWGRRTLEDNWRRRNKAMSMLEPFGGEVAPTDTIPLDEFGMPLLSAADSLSLLMDSLASDPKQREYYLQQIPFTEDDIESSNVIIADGLFNMGMIYKDKLEDKNLSLDAFEELQRRFPENKYRMDYFYHIFLMSLRYKDNALGEKYKQMLISAFPESDYAMAIADPNYEYNIRMMGAVQDSTYEVTYNSYLAGDTSSVRRNYEQFASTYPLSELIPKFMFLNALTYVQAGDTEGFKAALTLLTEKYPRADVTELANEMLKGLLRGRELVQGDFKGMTWNLRFGLRDDGTLSSADSALVFVDEPTTPHQMMLIFPTGSIDRNQLLFAVAAFNFANFEVKTFDMNFEEIGSITIMSISGFNNVDEILDYVLMIYSPTGYAASFDRAVSFIPISTKNGYTLLHGKTLEEYMSFFVEHYGDRASGLVARWRIQIDDEEVLGEAEDKVVEKAADVMPEEEDETGDDEIAENSDMMPTEENALLRDSLKLEIKDTVDVRLAEAFDDSVIPADSIGEIDILADSIVTDTTSVDIDTVKVTTRPKEITLDYLMEQRILTDQEAAAQKEEQAKLKEEKRKETAALRKQQEKERKQLLREKAKAAKEREKQRKKELREKERLNKQRLKEREAQRRAEQKAKAATQRNR